MGLGGFFKNVFSDVSENGIDKVISGEKPDPNETPEQAKKRKRKALLEVMSKDPNNGVPLQTVSPAPYKRRAYSTTQGLHK